MRRVQTRIFLSVLWLVGVGATGAQAEPQELQKPQAWASIGWSYLDLPDFAFTLTHQNRNAGGGFNPLQFVNRQVDDDGTFDNGYRFDFGLSGIPLSNGTQGPQFLGVKGFYAAYDASTATGCDETATSMAQFAGITCTFVPLTTQADIQDSYQLGATERHSGRVKRDVENWGAALEAIFTDGHGGPVAMKAGAAYRTIDQDIRYHVSGDQGFQAPFVGTADYSETLDTDYWGAYAGLIGDIDMGSGLSFVFDGEFGIYRAKTDYSGAYSYSITRVSSDALSLADDKMSYIATLKLELKQRLGMFNISAFTLGEYYSYAPRMVYKSNDVVNPGGGGALGDANATSIEDDDAWSVTTGTRVSVSLN